MALWFYGCPWSRSRWLCPARPAHFSIGWGFPEGFSTGTSCPALQDRSRSWECAQGEFGAIWPRVLVVGRTFGAKAARELETVAVIIASFISGLFAWTLYSSSSCIYLRLLNNPGSKDFPLTIYFCYNPVRIVYNFVLISYNCMGSFRLLGGW